MPLAIAVVVVALGLVGVGPVAANCNPEGTYPKFADAAATAETIIIGDVVALQEGGDADPVVDGRSGRCRLLVAAVVRGSAPRELTLADVTTRPCAPNVAVSLGDRMALALNAQDRGVDPRAAAHPVWRSSA